MEWTHPCLTEEAYSKQTFVVQKDDKKITGLHSSFHSTLDENFKNIYTKDDVELIPEIFIKMDQAGKKQFQYRIEFESKLPMEYRFTSRQFEGNMKFFLLCDASLPDYQLTDPVPN